ncbi:putative nicotinamide mononucleotide permease protein [Eutypa lata UCREL1]|uniref:Putative nicotinamide mononucleotide permease protein n=1 Tax=Eutypa lata (strain UCR-EL1) TaxID=1287681 RepID=M7T8Y1_EUTLA|nr:putative nicotinamide mononucleotide permease protein [Eutypa lata UCREL1]
MAVSSDKDVDQRVEHVSSSGSIKSGDTSNNKHAGADRLQAEQLAAQWVNGSPEEKKLVRKLDWRILPCTWILYLLGYLDRSNIGNAKTGGMEDDFNLTSDQYSIIVLVFFISYLVFEVPAILEGLVSVIAAVCVFFLMPDYPSTSQRFLKEDEGLLACNRLAVDGIASAQSAGTEQITHWDAFVMTVRDWRVWAQCILFVLVTGAQTMQYFIPTLVGTFGWTGYQGQYHTIPAYAAALVYVVVCCLLADKYKTKWPFICGLATVGCILFIAVTTTTNNVVQYVLTIFAFGTIYGCSPLVKTWVSDVIPQPAAKRAVAIALINSIGNASSIYSTWLWPSKDAPRYIPGFATTTSWLGLLAVLTVIFQYFFKKYPIVRTNHADAIAAELRAKREAGERETKL